MIISACRTVDLTESAYRLTGRINIFHNSSNIALKRTPFATELVEFEILESRRNDACCHVRKDGSWPTTVESRQLAERLGPQKAAGRYIATLCRNETAHYLCRDKPKRIAGQFANT